MRREWLMPAVLALGTTGCASVRHSVYRTTDTIHQPHRGEVTLSFTREPPAGEPVAIVQVYSLWAAAIDELLPEMTRVAAGLGADFVKVDRVKMRFEDHEESKTESYECGTKEEPKTCSETRSRTVHETTTQVLGRAFRTGGGR